MNNNSPFEYLINPVSKEKFFKNYYEKNFLHISNRDNKYYDHILTVKDIDEAFLLNKIPPEFINMANKTPLSHHYWTKNQSLKGVFTDIGKISDALKNGNSLVLNHLHKHIFNLQQFANQLSKELFINLWTNIYITPPSFQAFHRHYDTHDVFVLQIKGEKLWKIYDTPFALPHKTQSNRFLNIDLSEMKPVKELLMKEGDFLYIPRGMVHEAIATETLSTHVTVGLSPILISDLLKSFITETLKDDFFRKSILVDQQKVDKGTKKLFKQKLSNLIENTAFEELITETKEQFTQKHFSSSNEVNILSDYIQRNTIDNNTRIKKIASESYDLRMEGISLIIKLNEKEEKFPFFVRPLIDEIINSDAVTGILVKDIQSNFSEADKIKMIKQLVKLEIIDFV